MTRTALWLFGCVALLVTTPSWAGAGPDMFTRGDVNEDATIDIGDPVFILASLFAGGPQPNCPDAADVNDDGGVDVSDGIYLLSFLFVPSSPPPPAPFDTPGFDLTPDGMFCGTPCVDISVFEGLFTAGFPATTCLPSGTFTEAGATVDYCVQTTSPACFGAAGCETVIDLVSFSYDLATLEGLATFTITVDPVGINYSTFLGSGSCDGSIVLTVDATIIATGTETSPGVTEITDATVALDLVSSDVDLSACGVIGFLATFFVDSLIPGFITEFETAAQDQIAPLIVGTSLCTPTP